MSRDICMLCNPAIASTNSLEQIIICGNCVSYALKTKGFVSKFYSRVTHYNSIIDDLNTQLKKLRHSIVLDLETDSTISHILQLKEDIKEFGNYYSDELAEKAYTEIAIFILFKELLNIKPMTKKEIQDIIFIPDSRFMQYNKTVSKYKNIPKGIPFLYEKEDIEKILWVYGSDYLKSSLMQDI